MSILDNNLYLSFYRACQNNFLIVNLPDGFIWESNHEFRNKIAKIGIDSSIDSVLILSGSPFNFKNHGYHCTMEVYEPRSDSISTMCGNGVRAVCRYWLDRGLNLEKDEEFIIKTRSGLRVVMPVNDDLFRVNMGFLSTNIADLKKYVNNQQIISNGTTFEGIKFPKKIFLSRKYLMQKTIIGLTGDNIGGKIDGEPHLIFFVNNERCMSLQTLKKYATELGEILTSNRNLFPDEINVSVVLNRKKQSFCICTYERGVYYVTSACGTAVAVAGGYLLQKFGINKIEADTLGGQLLVEINSEKTIYLTGSAEPA